MVRIGIILGSTRPGRRGDQIAAWALAQARQRTDATFELIDIADFELPLFDESTPPVMRQYEREHTKRWSETIDSYDGFLMVVPEYNHSMSAALKNAIDFLYHEWTNKAVGFIGYGGAGGHRAIEHMRLVAGELQMADVRHQVTVSIRTDFEGYTTFVPSPDHEAALTTTLDQLVAWSTALRGVRQPAVAA